jgi:glycosyltransferase involved in cell wall biosynthesis
VKVLLGRKMLYWGQGRDLLHQGAVLKNALYRLEQRICDAIILYAPHLKRHVARRLHPKVFVANNTLCMPQRTRPVVARAETLQRYGIRTPKNIICMGRMQRRKRIDHLVEAIRIMARPDVGLIVVGPDQDGILDGIFGKGIYKIGAVYGDEKYDLLGAADVYCLPGAVGLSIVDAFHCGLPFVTEEGDESAEIMYLKHGINGFVVRRGDTHELAQKLQLLLDDHDLRRRFSAAARREIAQSGHIDRLCEGFLGAIRYVDRKVR